MVTGKRLMLRSGRWYGWQMLPGYADPDSYDPYYSPIRVDKVTPRMTGRGIFTLEFLNAAYAEGVKGSTLDLRVLQHGATYLVAQLLYGDDQRLNRAAVISVLTESWLSQHCPEIDLRRAPPDLRRQFR